MSSKRHCQTSPQVACHQYVLMIRSSSWEISAWKPKLSDSADIFVRWVDASDDELDTKYSGWRVLLGGVHGVDGGRRRDRTASPPDSSRAFFKCGGTRGEDSVTFQHLRRRRVFSSLFPRLSTAFTRSFYTDPRTRILIPPFLSRSLRVFHHRMWVAMSIGCTTQKNQSF